MSAVPADAGARTTDSAAIELDGLSRVYEQRARFRGMRRSTTALDCVTLRIPKGTVHGLLGPNGAGKTTLVKILSTVLLPTGGRAAVLGHDVVRDVAEVRRNIGLVFGGDRGLYTRLTARQTLSYWAALYRLPRSLHRERVDALLSRVGLADRADDPVETYSRGMKQRLHLARGLVGDPAVLLLDEPTSGLDPVGAREFRRLVDELRAEARTILLTTHDMVEAEEVCDTVSFIDRGRLLTTETPAAVRKLVASVAAVDVDGVTDGTELALGRIDGVVAVTRRPGGTVRLTAEHADRLPEVIGHLAAAGFGTLRTVTPTLEDVYLHIIGPRGLQV